MKTQKELEIGIMEKKETYKGIPVEMFKELVETFMGERLPFTMIEYYFNFVNE